MHSEQPKSIQARRRPQAMEIAIAKVGNTDWIDLGCSPRAAREEAVRGVAALGKGMPLPSSHALRLTSSQVAENTNSYLLEH